MLETKKLRSRKLVEISKITRESINASIRKDLQLKLSKEVFRIDGYSSIEGFSSGKKKEVGR